MDALLTWLRELGLERYAPAFAENEGDFDNFVRELAAQHGAFKCEEVAPDAQSHLALGELAKNAGETATAQEHFRTSISMCHETGMSSRWSRPKFLL